MLDYLSIKRVGNIYGGKPENTKKSHEKPEKQRKSAGKPEKTLGWKPENATFQSRKTGKMGNLRKAERENGC